MTDAERIAQALKENADAVHFDRVTWDGFSEKNHQLWREAERLGVQQAVMDALHGRTK
jgi:hypothetical protein